MSLTNSVDRRLAGFSASSVIPSPLFLAPLNATLKPQIGIGSYTFARASTATMRDFEGIVQSCFSGEARFSNARRVQNRLRNAGAKSANFQDGVWTAISCTINSPIRYSCTSATLLSGPEVASIYTGDAIGRIFNISFKARLVAGINTSLNLRLNSIGAGSPAHQSTAVTLTGSFQRFSSQVTITSGGGTRVDLTFRYTGTVDDTRIVEIDEILVELVTFQTNKNPADYVSYGMGADHGCGVDGVKWFSSANGNTVSSSVVTEAAGASLGSVKYLPEQEKTNLAWPSENLTHANWTKNFLTAAVSTTLTDMIGGLARTNTLKATDTSAHIHSVSMAVTTLIDDEDIVVAFFAKAGTLSHAFVRVSKGADTADQFFNVSAGTVGTSQDSGGDIAIHTDRIAIHAVNNGYWCHLVVNGAAAGAHNIHFGVSSADGATSFAASNTTDVLISMSGLQIQLDHEIGEYIPTVTGTVTKLGDTLRYDVANIPGDEFSAYVECDTEAPCVSNCAIISVENYGATNPGYFLSGFTGKFEATTFDNTDTRVYRAQSATVSPGIHKGAASFSRTAGERAAVLNGMAMTATIDLVDATTWSPNAFNVGFNNTDTGQPDFAIGNIRVYPKLSSDQLISLTQ